MKDQRSFDRDNDRAYTVTKKSDDGRIFEVTMTSGPYKGRSATMAAISSEFAYYNNAGKVPKKTK